MPNVYADSPSAAAEPIVLEAALGAVVSWHPERGWLCSVLGHHVQPCTHTVDLVVDPSPRWNQ